MSDKARRPGQETHRPLSLVGSNGAVKADGCLLEIVSRMAGEPWTDHPRCVHPALGAVARAVFDHSSERARESLVAMAPRLVNTAGIGLETPARLVATCVSTALASPVPERITAEETRRLECNRRTALYLLQRSCREAGANGSVEGSAAPPPRWVTRWCLRGLDPLGLTEPVYRRFVSPEAAAEAVVVTARASGPDRDQRLRELLRWCISVAVTSREGHGGADGGQGSAGGPAAD